MTLQQTHDPLSPPSTDQIVKFCRDGDLSSAVVALITAGRTNKIAISKNCFVYAHLLQASLRRRRTFSLGFQLHSHTLKSGHSSDVFVGNALLALYFSSGADIPSTQTVFDHLLVKDAVSWSTLLTLYSRSNHHSQTLLLFSQMHHLGHPPTAFTLPSAIKASSSLRLSSAGRSLHAAALTLGVLSCPAVCSALLHMYGNTSSISSARLLFDEMPNPDPISWTSLISACLRHDSHKEALALFLSMQKSSPSHPLDAFSLAAALSACANAGFLRQGRQTHARAITAALSPRNVFLQSAAVDMYAKCGALGYAGKVFESMEEKNEVSWCALLGGYCQEGSHEKVLELFREMVRITGGSDIYTLGTVLRACAGLAAGRQGREVHGQYLRRRGAAVDVVVESALVDVYGKCGWVEYGERVFKGMGEKNVITWNSMICGLAQNGKGREAVGVFEEMVRGGVKPDGISFVGVLFGCSHGGMVKEGREYFSSMWRYYRVERGVEHYSCMVDLLGRAGLVEEAEELVQRGKFRDEASLWEAVLGACVNAGGGDGGGGGGGGESGTAERTAKRLMEMAPEGHLGYVHLANAYSSVGRWGDALSVRLLMGVKGVRKNVGKSWMHKV